MNTMNLRAISLPRLGPKPSIVLDLWVAPTFCYLGAYSRRALTSGVEIPSRHISCLGSISPPSVGSEAAVVLELWVAPMILTFGPL